MTKRTVIEMVLGTTEAYLCARCVKRASGLLAESFRVLYTEGRYADGNTVVRVRPVGPASRSVCDCCDGPVRFYSERPAQPEAR